MNTLNTNIHVCANCSNNQYRTAVAVYGLAPYMYVVQCITLIDAPDSGQRSEIYIHSTYQCHTITDTKPHSGTVRTALVTLSHSAERARPERKSEETRVVMSAVACRLSSRTTGDQRGGRTCVTPLRHATQSTQQHRSPKARVKNVHDAEEHNQRSRRQLSHRALT